MRDELSVVIGDIYETAGALTLSGEAIASGHGVTLAQWHLLDAIDATTTAARAARRLGLSRQAVQRVANELEKRGLITFEPNPDHKTSPILAMTGAGARVLEGLWDAATASHEERFGSIPEADLELTAATLRRMTELTYRVYGS